MFFELFGCCPACSREGERMTVSEIVKRVDAPGMPDNFDFDTVEGVQTLKEDENHFSVVLSERHGLHVTALDQDANSCFITGISKGSDAAAWNSNCEDNQKLMRMDCIYEVDGFQGSTSDLKQRLFKDPANVQVPMQIKVKRPTTKFIEIDDFSQPLGLALKYEPEEEYFIGFLIVGIKDESAVAAYNGKNPKDPIRISDRIVGVKAVDRNYVETDKSMVQAMKDAKQVGYLSLKICSWDD
eukprot:TRINITY_DN8638_c0_g1_i11.p1 TRINITY_DN8638_c0_g1~~TRINITY_DN8638_c0_g1_i11.p1  ORF type:complete len:241 (+),score=40.35 TRINITY_DN8638_c0_g1_i11:134-856(+)